MLLFLQIPDLIRATGIAVTPWDAGWNWLIRTVGAVIVVSAHGVASFRDESSDPESVQKQVTVVMGAEALQSERTRSSFSAAQTDPQNQPDQPV
jgi:hypothetical protein